MFGIGRGGAECRDGRLWRSAVAHHQGNFEALFRPTSKGVNLTDQPQQRSLPSSPPSGRPSGANGLVSQVPGHVELGIQNSNSRPNDAVNENDSDQGGLPTPQTSPMTPDFCECDVNEDRDWARSR